MRHASGGVHCGDDDAGRYDISDHNDALIMTNGRGTRSAETRKKQDTRMVMPKLLWSFEPDHGQQAGQGET